MARKIPATIRVGYTEEAGPLIEALDLVGQAVRKLCTISQKLCSGMRIVYAKGTEHNKERRKCFFWTRELMSFVMN